jgi:hypothetical protein
LETNANPLHRPLAVGDWVIVGQGEEYASLVGQVTEIDILGSEDHDTGNPTDDVHVNLTLVEYSEMEMGEIYDTARQLGYDVDSLDEVPLDDVILAPQDLIRITPQELDEFRGKLSENMESAELVGEMLSIQHINEMQNTLVARVEQNYADYKRSLHGFGVSELIDMAATIHAWSDAYSYMSAWHGFEVDELSFYLQFEKPLEIVVDAWRKRNSDLDEMSFVMDFLNEPERRRIALEVYPLIGSEPVKQAISVEGGEHTESLTPQEQLYNKMSAEYKGFLDDMKSKPASDALEAAYEKVFKEDLLLTIENGDIEDEQITALLSLDTPLADLYWNWLDTDVTYMDMLRDSVNAYADAVISEQSAEQSKAEPVPIAEPIKEVTPQEPTKSVQKPATKQPPTLLGEVREAAQAVEARKAAQTAPNTTNKHYKEI